MKDDLVLRTRFTDCSPTHCTNGPTNLSDANEAVATEPYRFFMSDCHTSTIFMGVQISFWNISPAKVSTANLSAMVLSALTA